jgi:hypothetical protein
MHALLGERRFDGWAAALREHMELPYNTMLCGHGLPGGKELYDGRLNYLAAGEVTLGKAVDGDDLKRDSVGNFRTALCFWITRSGFCSRPSSTDDAGAAASPRPRVSSRPTASTRCWPSPAAMSPSAA